MREYALTIMSQAKPNVGLVCCDNDWSYFEIGVCGYILMYRQRRHKPEGRRCYYLGENLAKCLNFQSYAEMRWLMPSLQYWRQWVSVERLRVAFAKYDNKWGDLLQVK